MIRCPSSAGPYSPTRHEGNDCLQEVQLNVDRAVDAGILLLKLGHEPFIPHLSHYVALRPQANFLKTVYYDWDLSFLDHWAEGLVFLGSSPGADRELARAKDRGLTIFNNLMEAAAAPRGETQ